MGIVPRCVPVDGGRGAGWAVGEETGVRGRRSRTENGTEKIPVRNNRETRYVFRVLAIVFGG